MSDPERTPAALAEYLGLTVPQLLAQLIEQPQGAPVTLRTDRLGRGTRTVTLSRAEVQAMTAPPCPRCQGSGEVWHIPYDTPRECPDCEGQGTVYRPAQGLDPVTGQAGGEE